MGPYPVLAPIPGSSEFMLNSFRYLFGARRLQFLVERRKRQGCAELTGMRKRMPVTAFLTALRIAEAA
jgi:hypothetical protein